MKQKRSDSPSIFLAAAMAMAGAAMLLCPLIGQNTEMNQSAAEYDNLRVQLKSEGQKQAVVMSEHEKADRSVLQALLDAAGFPSATQMPLELPAQDESSPEIEIGTGADLAACLAQNDDFIAGSGFPARTWITPSSGRTMPSITCITRSQGSRARRERCFR